MRVALLEPLLRHPRKLKLWLSRGEHAFFHCCHQDQGFTAVLEFYFLLMEPLEFALLWMIGKARFSHGGQEAEAHLSVLHRR